jgi:hypothetical protein
MMLPLLHVSRRRTIFVALLLLVGSLPSTTSFVPTKSKLYSTVRCTTSTTRKSWHLGSAAGSVSVPSGETLNNSNDEETAEETDYLVCGGGPAGLLSAIMLAQKFPNVSFCHGTCNVMLQAHDTAKYSSVVCELGWLMHAFDVILCMYSRIKSSYMTD